MKAKLKPNRHGKWSMKKQDSIDKKMKLVSELFNLCGTELNYGNCVPTIKFIKFYGSERRFNFDADGQNVLYINQKFIRSSELDYIILCALCFFYTEKKPELIMGGKITMVDLHTCIDISDSVAVDILKSVARSVTSIALTRLIVSFIK